MCVHLWTSGGAAGVYLVEIEALGSLKRAVGLLIKSALMSQRDSSCFSPAVLWPGGGRLGWKRTSHLQVPVAGTARRHIAPHRRVSSSPHVTNEPVWLNFPLQYMYEFLDALLTCQTAPEEVQSHCCWFHKTPFFLKSISYLIMFVIFLLRSRVLIPLLSVFDCHERCFMSLLHYKAAEGRFQSTLPLIRLDCRESLLPLVAK